VFGVTATRAKLYLQQWTGQLSEYITALSWSIQGYLAACSAGGEVMFWRSSTQSPSLILTPVLTPEPSIDCLQFSADGQFLAAGGQDGQIRIWQMSPQLG
jgi:WD40 repeat protein